MQVLLTDREIYMLDVIDALGGSARKSQIAVAADTLLSSFAATMLKLCDHGLLRIEAGEHYALTPRGRAALASPLDLARAV